MNRSLGLIRAIGVALCLLGSTASWADAVQCAQTAGRQSDKLSMKVSVADLNLSTPAGMRTASERFRTAARKLCGRFVDELDLGSQTHFAACVDQAVADAQHSLFSNAADGVRQARAH